MEFFKVDFNPEEMVEMIAQAVTRNILAEILPILQPAEADEIIGIEEAGRLLKTTKEQIYQWVHAARYGQGDFPFLKTGKRLKFSRKALLTWAKRR